MFCHPSTTESPDITVLHATWKSNSSACNDIPFRSRTKLCVANTHTGAFTMKSCTHVSNKSCIFQICSVQCVNLALNDVQVFYLGILQCIAICVACGMYCNSTQFSVDVRLLGEFIVPPFHTIAPVDLNLSKRFQTEDYVDQKRHRLQCMHKYVEFIVIIA